MEFITKGSERLNIYLTKEDLKAQNFSTAELYTYSGDIKKRLSSLFDTIKQKTGFNTDSSGLEIDIIPILGGDLLLSISRTLFPLKTVCFEFTELEEVFSVVSLLPEKTRKSSLYKYGGGYVLVIDASSYDMCILTEHATLIKIIPSVIYEHGSCLIKDNALEIIHSYFPIQ